MMALPIGWSKTTIDQIADINPRHAQDLEDSLRVTFVRMPAISETDSNFKFGEERLLGQVRKGFTHFAEGDVLFAKITPCMENGKAAVAAHLINGLGCGTTELHVLRPREGINPKYLYFYIHRVSFREEAARNFTGTAGQLRVPVSFMREAQIPLAPLNEQRRVVPKLEKLLSRVDAAQTRLATIPRILKRFRQSVLAAACSGRLTVDWRKANQNVESVPLLSEPLTENGENELPDTWVPVRVGDVINGLKYGTSQKCSYEKVGVPVLRIPNIGEGVIETTDLKYAQLPRNEFQKLKLSPGDILLIRSNGSVALVGKTALVRESEKDFAYAGYLIRLKPNRSYVEPEFLNLALSSYNVRLQIEIPARSTSGVNNINSDEVRALEIALAPLAEQEEIVRRVEALFKTADALEARYRKAKAYVDKLTQSILAKAFRGELVPQDPNDEPASVLLERIRQANQGKSSGKVARPGRRRVAALS